MEKSLEGELGIMLLLSYGMGTVRLLSEKQPVACSTDHYHLREDS